MAEERTAHVVVDGEWTAGKREAFAELLLPAFATPSLLVDLAGVSSIDAGCLDVLHQLQTERCALGLLPARFIVNEELWRLFRVAQLDAHWPGPPDPS